MVFTSNNLNIDFSTSDYGTMGYSRKVLINLYKQGWSKEFLGQFMYSSEKLLDEVEKNYIDLIGLDCAKLELLLLETSYRAENLQEPLQAVCLDLMSNDPVLLGKTVREMLLAR